MTPEERAEKIVSDCPDGPEAKAFIAAQIREAEMQAGEAAVKICNIVHAKEISAAEAHAHHLGFQEGLRAGKLLAFEEAAEIAEMGPRPGGIVTCDGDVRDPGVVVTGFQKWIAHAIRARAKEVCK